jgi:hypothetical protein
MGSINIKHRVLDTNPERETHWEDLSINVRAMLKYSLKEKDGELWTGLVGSREESGSWELSNNFSGYIKDKIIVD